MDAVAHGAPSAAGTRAARGFAPQPVFILQPVERRLYRVICGQATPLVTANIAQRKTVFEYPTFKFRRQRLRSPQLVILEQPITAPRVRILTGSPGSEPGSP